MSKKKTILAIIGSASLQSSNEKLIDFIKSHTSDHFEWTIFNHLKSLPHFDPELSINNPPLEVMEFRNLIAMSEGIIISTPEYVFSIPSGLKNALEWCVATTVITDKPTGIITASSGGEKAHAELQLIMRTLMADFNPSTTLLIQGIKGKLNEQGQITDAVLLKEILMFIDSFSNLLDDSTTLDKQ